MEKPCDKCTVNLEQAAFSDEVSCFRNCSDFARWRVAETKPVALCSISDRADSCIFDQCSIFEKCFP